MPLTDSLRDDILASVPSLRAAVMSVLNVVCNVVSCVGVKGGVVKTG